MLHLPLGAGDDEAVHVELHERRRARRSSSSAPALELTLAGRRPGREGRRRRQRDAARSSKDGDVSMKSRATLEIKASSKIKIEASGELTLKGATVNIN